MVYTPNYSFIESMFQGTWAFGLSWIIPLIIGFLAMAVITRDVEKWKILFFPIQLMLLIIGLPVSPAILLIGAIIFVIEALSTQVLGGMVKGLSNRFTHTRLESKIMGEKKKFASDLGKKKGKGQFERDVQVRSAIEERIKQLLRQRGE
jgi:hypothetical protein